MRKFLPAFVGVVAGLLVLSRVAVARADDKPTGTESDRIRILEDELKQLRASQEKLRQSVEGMRATEEAHDLSGGTGDHYVKHAQHVKETAPSAFAAYPIKFYGNVAIRYDTINNQDQNDLIYDPNYINGFRTRIRFGLTYDDPGAIVAGGIRLSTFGSSATSPFLLYGGGLTTKPFGLDQYWGSLRPFKDRDRLSITFGKMPNPFWRGDVGAFRSQLIWDDDVNPEGLSLHVTFYKDKQDKPSVKIDNTFAYFVLEDIFDLRFRGITGPVSMIQDQLRLVTKNVTIAAAYIDFENLNSGLRSPNFVVGQSVSLEQGQNAFLLRPGFQFTNNHVNYGPGAEGFRSNSFRMVNATIQAHVKAHKLTRLGMPKFFILADYVHNFSVPTGRDGIGVTVGVNAGSFDPGVLNPFNFWLTYGYVDGDATLGTISDSDFGRGTQYYGVRIHADYAVFKNLAVAGNYLHFYGYPLKNVREDRFFFDAVWSF